MQLVTIALICCIVCAASFLAAAFMYTNQD
jgi:hypothetical protein